ncbi:helix-turn-helix domain-containing protein [Flavobacterium sp. GA093]|uniref:Helix-turn-helix domain-containing protein n=1 Tax=Flavobacterium hydrocarbonoxydans TaxID=2683249 RepID=A0A6I4NQ16_9FLAO|nr:helix-turn-helix transcriptional regulator [Flavobacterium hydrocarbonoxydans]MWB96273.1 helix-turn-helix domain-containing protein [Flavobacterium hydrocarbonoxydans]
MVNIDDFVKRLEIILDYYALNASSFADKIGVQRSSMSHLLSGRNKPSLDFVLKILDVFPDVDLYWILNGKGSFPKSTDETVISKNSTISETRNKIAPVPSFETDTSDLFSTITNQVDKNNTQLKSSNIPLEENEIEKIVFFYKNGTFKVYNP